MGEGEHGMFEFSLDDGPDIPTRIGKWAHLACLNANLHPAHIIQAWKADPAQIERDAERLLRGEELRTAGQRISRTLLLRQLR